MANTVEFNDIADARVDAYSPLTAKLITRIRDNVYAGRYEFFWRWFPEADIGTATSTTVSGRIYIPQDVIGATNCAITINWTARNIVNDGVGDISTHRVKINSQTFEVTRGGAAVGTTESTYNHTGSAGLVDLDAYVSDVGGSGGTTTINWIRMELTP